jgi:hypothetical protein
MLLGGARRRHQTSSAKPSAQVERVRAKRIRRSRRFFSDVRRLGAGDPVLGPLPADAQLGYGSADGFVADASARQPLCKTDLGHQLQGPHTGTLAKHAGTLVYEGPEPFEPLGIEGGVGRMRPGGGGREGGEATGVNSVDRIAHRLVVAP